MTLHHIHDLSTVLAAFATLLADGGHLCIADLEKEDGSFHGGDFANTDILRVNLLADYDVRSLASPVADEYLLELRAKNDSISYSRIVYAIRKRDFMPQRQEFFTASAKMIRKLTFTEPRAFGKHVRPSHLTMENLLVVGRRTDMIVKTFKVVPNLDSGLFELAALGR